jgi:hypothetical protein
MLVSELTWIDRGPRIPICQDDIHAFLSLMAIFLSANCNYQILCSILILALTDIERHHIISES